MLINIFLRLLEVSISTSFIILPLCLFSRRLNRRYESRWILFIWIALALRLLIPINLPSIYEISILPDLTSQHYVQTQDYLQDGSDKSNLEDQMDSTREKSGKVAEPEYPDQNKSQSIETEATMMINWTEIAAIVWCIGICCFSCFQLSVYAIFRCKLLKNGTKLKNNAINAFITAISSELGLQKRIHVIVSGKSSSPMMVGIIRPIFVIPCKDYSYDEFDMIARHELTHCKRKDILLKTLLTAVNAIHWFNPLVYLMVREANANIELCCDVDVLQNADHTRRKEYVDSILMSMERCKGSMLGSTYFSHGGVSKMKERFENIYNIDKKRTGVILFAIIVIMSIILGTFVSCGAEVQAQGQDFALISSELTDKSDNYSDVRIIDKSNYSEDVTITDDGFYESSIKNVFISYDMSQALDDAKGSNSLLFVEILIDCQDIEDQWFKYNGKTLRKIKNAQVLLEYNKEFELWLSEKYPDLDEERKQNNHKIDNWEKHDIQEQFHKYWTKHHTDEEADKYVSAINELSQAKEAFLDWKKTKDYINVYNKEKKEQVNRMAKNGIDVRFINSKILGYLSYTDIASFHAENGVTYSISWATDFSEAWRK